LDVLARAERIGHEVRASAMIVARLQTADGYAVIPTRLWIRHLEFGEDGLIADVRQPVFHFAPELSPQLNLPFFQRHLGRFDETGQLSLRRLPALLAFLAVFSSRAVRIWWSGARRPGCRAWPAHNHCLRCPSLLPARDARWQSFYGRGKSNCQGHTGAS